MTREEAEKRLDELKVSKKLVEEAYKADVDAKAAEIKECLRVIGLSKREEHEAECIKRVRDLVHQGFRLDMVEIDHPYNLIPSWNSGMMFRHDGPAVATIRMHKVIGVVE